MEIVNYIKITSQIIGKYFDREIYNLIENQILATIEVPISIHTSINIRRLFEFDKYNLLAVNIQLRLLSDMV